MDRPALCPHTRAMAVPLARLALAATFAVVLCVGAPAKAEATRFDIRPGPEVNRPCDAITGTLRVDGDRLRAEISHPDDSANLRGTRQADGRFELHGGGQYVTGTLSGRFTAPGTIAGGRLKISGQEFCDDPVEFVPQ